MKRKKDLLKGAFGVAKSPFIREVGSSSPELTLDLARPSQ
jgi:hypothetical protein